MPHLPLKSLKEELEELPAFLKIFNQESGKVQIKKVTMVSTICEILNHKPSFKLCNPNLHKLVLLYCSIPLSSSTAERTFSAMRHVKTWHRSSMTANALTNRMFAVLHKSLLDDVDTKRVAHEFIAKQHVRLSYFGKFD